jgi:sugar lactone lactonase YvrE
VANLAGNIAVYRLDHRRPVRTFPATVNGFSQSHLAFDSSGDLYVSHFDDGMSAIDVYAAESGARLRTITSGLYFPNAIALDGADNLYVADEGSKSDAYAGAITVYAPGSTAVQRTITDKIDNPTALLFDTSGNLYVANQAANNVTVYAPGQATPFRTITKGIDSPSALAFDSQRNIYVANRPYGSDNNDTLQSLRLPAVQSCGR